MWVEPFPLPLFPNWSPQLLSFPRPKGLALKLPEGAALKLPPKPPPSKPDAGKPLPWAAFLNPAFVPPVAGTQNGVSGCAPKSVSVFLRDGIVTVAMLVSRVGVDWEKA